MEPRERASDWPGPGSRVYSPDYVTSLSEPEGQWKGIAGGRDRGGFAFRACLLLLGVSHSRDAASGNHAQAERDGEERLAGFFVADFDGKMVSPRDFAGKVLLVNVWATWCAPCVKEFPSMMKLVEAFDGKVAVLAISQDRSREDIDSFVKAFGTLPKDFVIVWDKERKSSELLGTDALPETFILTPQQKLLRKVAGETNWSDAMAMDFFRDILEASAVPGASSNPHH
ncbi:MAG: TlpA family protein disulfide reductase [Calothrix sp. SM1_5_4]|nr:TlpA family protein disulfide reductase [Calothrix sp. SM1_5_4]